MDVAGRHAVNAEAARELCKREVSHAIATPERTLELDPEAIRCECSEQAATHTLGLAQLSFLNSIGERTVTRASRQVDEAVGVTLELIELDLRRRTRAPRAPVPISRSLVGK